MGGIADNIKPAYQPLHVSIDDIRWALLRDTKMTLAKRSMYGRTAICSSLLQPLEADFKIV